MVIVKIFGGLGNQMFQYAFGKALADHYKTELKLDIGGFSATVGDPKLGIRVFSLGNFNIKAPIATVEEIAPFKNFTDKVIKKISLYFDNRPSYYDKKIILEPKANHFCFDENVFRRTRKGDFYCEGFFQSPKYFAAVADDIRQEFTVKHKTDSVNATMLAKISSENSVALHIRHGDNANNVAKAHGVLSLNYYQKALELLSKQEKDLHIYVFSDDPKWAKENLQTNHPTTFVSHNGDAKNYEDLHLMITCKHHIIGNSTFSWWGAWLGLKSGQRVFAPRNYYLEQDVSGTDFYPPTWNVI